MLFGRICITTSRQQALWKEIIVLMRGLQSFEIRFLREQGCLLPPMPYPGVNADPECLS